MKNEIKKKKRKKQKEKEKKEGSGFASSVANLSGRFKRATALVGFRVLNRGIGNKAKRGFKDSNTLLFMILPLLLHH